MLTAIILYLTFAAICTVVLCAACMVSGQQEPRGETTTDTQPSRSATRALLNTSPPRST